MTAPLMTALEGTTFRITLNSPERRNALSMAMLDALDAALDAAQDSIARVIILDATGNVFCPGHDLKEMRAARTDPDGGRAFYTRVMRRCAEVMQKIVHHPLPVIADVRGMATAAGCQLVASADLAVASVDARFATPGVNIGLFCSTPMVALSRNVTRKHAMEMLLLGTPISASKAAQIGLINTALPADEVGAEVARLAEIIAGKSTVTVSIGKKAFYEQAEMPLAQAYDHCAEVMVKNMMTHDAEEGISAFVEKRDPTWADR